MKVEKIMNIATSQQRQKKRNAENQNNGEKKKKKKERLKKAMNSESKQHQQIFPPKIENQTHFYYAYKCITLYVMCADNFLFWSFVFAHHHLWLQNELCTVSRNRQTYQRFVIDWFHFSGSETQSSKIQIHISKHVKAMEKETNGEKRGTKIK